jgi:hypothetical protein
MVRLVWIFCLTQWLSTTLLLAGSCESYKSMIISDVILYPEGYDISKATALTYVKAIAVTYVAS